MTDFGANKIVRGRQQSLSAPSTSTKKNDKTKDGQHRWREKTDTFEFYVEYTVVQCSTQVATLSPFNARRKRLGSTPNTDAV